MAPYVLTSLHFTKAAVMASTTPTSGNEFAYMMRSMFMNQALSSTGKISFGREKLLQILKVFIIFSGFENIVDPLLRKLPTVPRLILRKFLCMIQRMRSLTCQHLLKITALETRSTTVSSITNSIQENYLYKSVEWWINKHIQKDVALVKKETVMEKLSGKKDIIVTLPESKETLVDFQGYTITVKKNSEPKEILTDRPVKRTNHIYHLKVTVKETEERDILEDFVSMCDNEYQKWQAKQNKVPKVYRNVGSSEWKESGPIRRRRQETVVLRDNMTKAIFDDLERFHTAEEKYVSRDITYTRHYLFYGLPGTGKSSLLNAIATLYQRSIYFLNLSSVMSDEELHQLMEKIPMADSIVVFEDIDAANEIVMKREQMVAEGNQVPLVSVTSETGKGKGKGKEEESPKYSTLSLAGLLAAIDGTGLEVHNQIMIMTTNHVKKLDPALIRAGRVDRKWEFMACNNDHADALFCNFFERRLNRKLEPKMPAKTLTPADLAGVFIRYLESDTTAEEKLHQYWATGECDD